MSMEPADIDKVEFKTTRVKEGYDQDEVDTFLDRVRDQWDDDRNSLAACRAELARVQRALGEAQAIADAYDTTAPIPVVTPAESATRILEFAQKTADEVMADARAQADQALAAARNDAERLKNDARGVVYQLEQEVKALTGKQKEIEEYLRGYLRRALNDLEKSGG